MHYYSFQQDFEVELIELELQITPALMESQEAKEGLVNICLGNAI